VSDSFDQLLSGVTGITFPASPSPARRLDVKAGEIRRREVIRKALAYHMEGLRLYRPLPHLEPFHASRAKWRVIDGSNRSSKTMSGCVEGCRAWLGCDPYDKYVRKGGNAIVVGMKWEQIEMIWRKCAKPGAFKIIRDEKTRLWRAVRPDLHDPLHLDPYDEAFREKWRDAPPLIPPRMIAGRIAWEDRAKGIPTFVAFTTGWSIHFYSSNTIPPQGDHYHFALKDEELLNPLFVDEIKRGLVALDEPYEHRPRGIWSATAQTTNPELLQMREQAEAGSSHVHAFKALLKDNPYVPDEEKQIFHDSLSEDDRKVRYYGEYALAGRRCYPTFDPQGIHGYEPKEIPPTWCRYLVLDPGGGHKCGTLFVAVDPQEKHVWAYEELNLQNSDPATWAQRIAAKGEQFEAGVIDMRAGKQKSMGLAVANVARSYADALEAAGVEFRQKGPMEGFFPGNDDVAARQAALRAWMSVRQHDPFAGTPKLLVARGCLPHLEEQIRHAHMDFRNPEKRAKAGWGKLPEDILVCAEYLAAFNPRYFEPSETEVKEGDQMWEKFQRQQRQMDRRGKPSQSIGSVIELG
jgi:hypothetical protein